jgi:hypothetical protein
VEEAGNAFELGDVLVFPDTEVAWGNTGFRADGGCLGDDEAGAANGAASEVDEVPIVGKTVDGGVFAHGGYGDAIGQSEAAELEGGEEVVRWLGHRVLDVPGAIWMWRPGLGGELKSAVVLSGVLGKRGGFLWLFDGEDVVKCVVNVVRRQRLF